MTPILRSNRTLRVRLLTALALLAATAAAGCMTTEPAVPSASTVRNAAAARTAPTPPAVGIGY